MKNFKKLAALAVATASVVAAPAFAAPVSDTNGSARVKIVRGLTIENTGEIDFGTIILPGTSTGTDSVTVSVAADDGAFGGCAASSFTCSIADGGTTTREQYTLTGTRAVNVIVTVPQVATMYIDGNTANPSLDVSLASNLPAGTVSGATTLHTVTLPNSGAAGSAAGYDFDIGGSITVFDTTPDGAYSGTFTVSADYE